jgi:hypothetical protein
MYPTPNYYPLARRGVLSVMILLFVDNPYVCAKFQEYFYCVDLAILRTGELFKSHCPIIFIRSVLTTAKALALLKDRAEWCYPSVAALNTCPQFSVPQK